MELLYGIIFLISSGILFGIYDSKHSTISQEVISKMQLPKNNYVNKENLTDEQVLYERYLVDPLGVLDELFS